MYVLHMSNFNLTLLNFVCIMYIILHYIYKLLLLMLINKVKNMLQTYIIWKLVSLQIIYGVVIE